MKKCRCGAQSTHFFAMLNIPSGQRWLLVTCDAHQRDEKDKFGYLYHMEITMDEAICFEIHNS
jgi:hypothetical protein